MKASDDQFAIIDEQLKNIQIQSESTIDQEEMKKVREELNILKGRYSAVSLRVESNIQMEIDKAELQNQKTQLQRDNRDLQEGTL